MKNKKWLKQKIRQSLTLIIVILLICPLNLAAKKKGAQLRIEKEDGEVIEGELLTVKENSLLIMTSASNTGVTIDIHEIEKVGIKRKSKVSKGALTGAVVFGGVGYALGGVAALLDDNQKPTSQYRMPLALKGAALGALLIGTVSAISNDYKTHQVKGKSPAKIEKILKKLRKKARFKT